MQNFGVQYNWAHALGSGIAFSFQVGQFAKTTLARMSLQLWANDAAGPDLIPVDGHAFIRSNSPISAPVAEVLDLTSFVGINITANAGQPFCTVHAPWEGCLTLNGGKLYDVITFPTTNGIGAGTTVFAFLNLQFL